jgi:hypothetical protein
MVRGAWRKLDSLAPLAWELAKRDNVSLCPRSEGLPDCRVAEGISELLHRNQKPAGPERDAYELDSRPPVVSQHKSEEGKEANGILSGKRRRN